MFRKHIITSVKNYVMNKIIFDGEIIEISNFKFPRVDEFKISMSQFETIDVSLPIVQLHLLSSDLSFLISKEKFELFKRKYLDNEIEIGKVDVIYECDNYSCIFSLSNITSWDYVTAGISISMKSDSAILTLKNYRKYKIDQNLV